MRIAKTSAYWWPVELQIPEEDDQVSTISGEFKFIRVRNDEIENIFKDSEGKDTKICLAVVHGWRGLSDVDGTPIEYNDENRAELFSYPMIAAELVRCWARSLSAVAKKS